jgi:hypothetical protein
MIRTAIAAAVVALFSFLLLPLGAFSQKAGADVPGVTTVRFFERDTQQTNLDFGGPGEGPGDQSLFSGDVFDQPGGRIVGHTAGQCTALSGDAAAGDILCAQTLFLDGGQINIQGVSDRAALFGRGETVPFAIVGGTGIYNSARGDGTIQVPVDVPHQTDANFVLNVITG